MNIHLCIVTGQPLANLIPILQEKPSLIILVVSKDMEGAAQIFLTTLKQAGWAQEDIHLYEDLPSSNHDLIFEKAVEIEDFLNQQHPDGQVTFNATGGNKLMALAFMSVFGSGSHRVIYTDTRNQHIEVLYPANNPAIKMQSVLTLPLYLKAEGKTLRSRQDDDAVWKDKANKRRKATQYMARNADQITGLVSQFNRHFSVFNDNQKAPDPIKLSSVPKGSWKETLALLCETGVLDGENDRWYPVASDCARYLSGSWIEEYVWLTAIDSGAEDVALSLEFTDDYSRKENIRNEIDVAVLHENRLLLIECKTGNIALEGKESDMVYKLDSLAEQAGGQLAEAALVSFNTLVRTNNDGRTINAKARARSLNIHTCEGSDLTKLGHYISSWVQKGSWPSQ